MKKGNPCGLPFVFGGVVYWLEYGLIVLRISGVVFSCFL